MKVIAIVRAVFTLVGLGLLVGAFFSYRSGSAYVESASRATGTVIELARSRSEDSTTYRPVVRFTAEDGRERELTSSSSSNPPSYAVGETVEVLYFRDARRNARINGFFELWGGALILGGLGALFFLIGAGMFVVPLLLQRRAEHLKAHGTPIQTQLQSVELNTSLSMNGAHPFRVVTQWLNPATSQIHVFRSANLWFDPSAYLVDRPIRVFIERDNPKKYHVDLSFLPSMAD